MKAKNATKSMMIAAALLCGAVNNAQAQDYYNTKHEVSVSVGAAANSSILNTLSDFDVLSAEVITTAIMTGGHAVGYTSYEDDKEIPAISAEYFYHINKTVGLGAIAAFNSLTNDMYCNIQVGDRTSKEKIGDAKRTNFSIMPAAKFDWLRKKNFGMYSKVAVGVTFMSEKQTVKNDNNEKEVDSQTRVVPNFQLSLLGLEAGSEKLRGFVELGMGEQGIAQAGVRVKF